MKTFLMEPLSAGLFVPVMLACLLGAPAGLVAQEALDPGPVDDPASKVQIQPLAEGTFNFSVRNTELSLVLRQLNTQVRKNIIISPNVRGEVTVDLYGVTFEQALEAVLHSSGMVAVEKNDMIYIYTPEEYAKLAQAKRNLEVKVFHLEYLTAKDALELVKDQLSAQGKISFTPESRIGITTSSTGGDVETGGNEYANQEVLVVRDYPENIEAIDKLVEELDIRPEQILIESTIMRATLTDTTAMGVDLQYYTGLSKATVGVPQGNPSNSVNNGTWNTTNFDATQSIVGTNFAANLPAAVLQNGSFTFGIISDNLAAYMKAVESVTDLTIIANPKLLILNKQQGSVLVGDKIGYRDTTTQTETSATSSVNFLETGTNLVVRPFISKDGYIRMELQPKDSTGQLNQVGQDVLPEERTTQVTTNMLVRDGQTIVIGGLFRERTNRDRNQLPVLGEIPILGMAARNRNDQSEREEVIILVTPHIVAHPPDEEISNAMKQKVDDVMLGSRRGLAWWSANRLAEEYVQSARQAMAEGDPGQALWDVNCALSIHSNHREAMNIKDILSPAAPWAKAPAALTTYNIVERMIAQDQSGKHLTRPPVRDRRMRQYNPLETQKQTPAGATPPAMTPAPKPLSDEPTTRPVGPADAPAIEPDTSRAPSRQSVPKVLTDLMEQDQRRQARAEPDPPETPQGWE